MTIALKIYQTTYSHCAPASELGKRLITYLSKQRTKTLIQYIYKSVRSKMIENNGKCLKLVICKQHVDNTYPKTK